MHIQTFAMNTKGQSILMHAFCSRVAEFTKDITQVGIRAQCKEEYDFIKKNKIKTFYAYAISNGLHGKNWQEKVIKGLEEKCLHYFRC